MKFSFYRNDLKEEPKWVTGFCLKDYPKYTSGYLYWGVTRKEALELIWQLMKDIIRGPKF